MGWPDNGEMMTEHPGRSLTGLQIGHYQIRSLLGAGGMGEVYLADDTRLQRKVAIKFLPPESGKGANTRLLHEARAAARLDHPNICAIHEVGEAEGHSFIVMQYVEGETLATRMARKPLDMRAAVTVATQVAEALAEAHDHGLVHRDVKPQNIMLSARAQVKVLDFGLATVATPVDGEAETASLMAQTGVIAGTVPYMSPEQLRGEALDHRSDIFSFGSVLQEVLTGKRPFAGASVAETMSAILTREPPPLQHDRAAVPAELQRIVRKCLEKDVERRYQSAQDLVVDLRNLKRDTDADITRATIGEARHDNLPEQLTSFIGRSQEIAAVRRLLSSTRLLTLTGAGGCGKTRLALQVAAGLLDQFVDGVWVVDLAPLSEPDLIDQTMAAVLGVRDGPGRSLGDALADFLRQRDLLIVLDNCEHLISASAHLAETLLRAAPKLHLLATSREGLGILGETVWRVPSLSLPDPSQALSPEALQEYEAAHLFVDRAAAIEPTFAVTQANATTIAEVCHRLDGIPLALELAAARVKVLSVEQINVRLKDRFRLLTGGSRTAVARQRTLEATVDWSYDLLSERERLLLCRLSVFPAGWTLEVAEEVCSGDGIEQDDMLDLLSRLVDKSLVIVEDDATGDRRYRFLETVRQYGRERLLRSGEAERVRDLHLAFFFELVRRAEPELQKADQVAWLNRLQVEHDNLRAALEWCLAAPERGDTGLELAAALTWFWTKRGYFGEGRQWLERALAASGKTSAALRVKALIGLWHMTFFQGDYARTLALSEESLTLGRQADDLWTVAYSLFMQGCVIVQRGDVAQATRLAAEGQTAAIASGDLWIQAALLELHGFIALYEGHYDRAGQLFNDALELFRETGDKWGISRLLCDFGQLLVPQGHYAQAKVLGAEGIALSQELGDRREVAWYLEIFAAAAAAQGESGGAARLWGASDRLLESVASPLLPEAKLLRDRYFDSAKESLGEGPFQAALSEGRAMPLNQAVQYALEDSST